MRRVVRDIGARRDRIVVADVFRDAEFVRERAQFLLDGPQPRLHDLLVARDGAAAIGVGDRAAGGRHAACRGQHGRIPVGGGDGLAHVVGRAQRVVTREHGDGVQIALEVVELVRHVPAVQLLLEIRADQVRREAAAVAQVVRERLARAGFHGEVAHLVAHQGAAQRVEAGERRDRVAVVRRNQRHARVERVLVGRRAGVDGQLALVQLAGQRCGQLAAVVGREAGVAHAVRRAVEAADHAVPAVGDLAAVDAVEAAQAARARREAQAAFRLVAAFLHDKVHRGARLAARINRARAAAQHFHALDRVIQAEGGRAFEERQHGHREDRVAVHLHGNERRVAARREAAHLDVGAGLAARRFGVYAWHDLQHVGRRRGRRLLQLFFGRGRDREARVDLARAGGRCRTGHDHLLDFFLDIVLSDRLGLDDEGEDSEGNCRQLRELHGVFHFMLSCDWEPAAGRLLPVFLVD